MDVTQIDYLTKAGALAVLALLLTFINIKSAPGLLSFASYWLLILSTIACVAFVVLAVLA